MRSAFLLLLLLVFLFASSSPVLASSNPSYDSAWSLCQQQQAQDQAYADAQAAQGAFPEAFQCVVATPYVVLQQRFTGSSPTPWKEWQQYPFTGDPPPPPPECTAGSSVAAGTQVQFFAAPGSVGPNDGTMCHSGCQVTLNINIGASGATGGYVESGSSCPAASTATPTSTPTLSKPSETSHPDGSVTFCDTISGKCVTAPAPSDSPASASSSPNDSTSSSTVTDNPATTSSSTTVTAPASGSSSGASSGSSVGSTSSTHTDNPASASSSSTRCTTGVCDVGNADGDIGGLYTPSGDSIASEYSAFVSQVQQSPLISAAKGFFSVSASGSCPSWSIPATAWWPNGLSFDFFCQPAILSIMSAAGYIVLAVGAFRAFTIAFY